MKHMSKDNIIRTPQTTAAFSQARGPTVGVAPRLHRLHARAARPGSNAQRHEQEVCQGNYEGAWGTVWPER